MCVVHDTMMIRGLLKYCTVACRAQKYPQCTLPLRVDEAIHPNPPSVFLIYAVLFPETSRAAWDLWQVRNPNESSCLWSPWQPQVLSQPVARRLRLALDQNSSPRDFIWLYSCHCPFTSLVVLNCLSRGFERPACLRIRLRWKDKLPVLSPRQAREYVKWHQIER